MADDTKYTISYINETPGLVVRADTPEEMDTLIRGILPIYKKFRVAVDKGKQARMQQQIEQAPPPQETPICGIHGTQMVWKTGVSKKTNKPYAFWACSSRNADGSYCQYKPQ